MRGSSWKLIAILVLAVSLRLVAALVIGDAHVPWAYEYEAIAGNVAENGTYAYSFYNLTEPRPTSFQPPIYPLFLAFTIAVDPDGRLALRAVQIAASVLSVWLLYRVVLTTGRGATEALLAAAMMAVYPPLVGYAVLSSPVTLETLFLLSGLLFLLEARKRTSNRHALAAGVGFALAGLTRSPWLLTVPITMAWLAIYSRVQGWRRFRPAIYLGVVALLILAPWAFRNAQVHGVWSVAGTNGGLNFWIGNNPEATGEYLHPTAVDRELALRTAQWPEFERDRFFYRRGLEYIRSNPGEWSALATRKLRYFLLFRPSMGNTYAQSALPIDLARRAYQASWLLLLPLAVLGVAFDRDGRWGVHLLLLSIFLSQALVAVAYFTGTRFRTPMEPFFILWAATFLHRAWQRIRDRTQPRLEHA